MSMDMELAKTNPGHLSRKDNQSISSNHSGRSRSASHPAVESAVTRLLVAIKQLLEALTSWSQLKMDENQVSDVYVRLGNDFNAAVAAFSAFNIDMRELLSVPEDLRTVLEACLAEDATPENLERFLPIVRQIITNLLQGLRGKQSIYRRIVSEHRHKSDQPPVMSGTTAGRRAPRDFLDAKARIVLLLRRGLSKVATVPLKEIPYHVVAHSLVAEGTSQIARIHHHPLRLT
ncbi:Bud site selection protein 6 [Pleurotus ostreatus]|nr:Bud site selection protein 6 [Pleurotus ostreatus]